jgi:hypothetical protein
MQKNGAAEVVFYWGFCGFVRFGCGENVVKLWWNVWQSWSGGCHFFLA